MSFEGGVKLDGYLDNVMSEKKRRTVTRDRAAKGDTCVQVKLQKDHVQDLACISQ